MEIEQNSELKKPRSQRYVDWWLGIISFTESSFLPILVDPFLVAMTLARPKCWSRFIMIASVTSVLGGMFGYLLGAVFFELIGVKIVAFYNLEEVFARTVTAADDNAFYFTLIGAFTPIPYKLVALAGGFLKINILLFILASIIGRFARFAIVGYITKQFGDHALHIFKRRFGVMTVALVCGVGAYFVLLLVG
jgi:membrane protein YqaA with SNARE-associated domain